MEKAKPIGVFDSGIGGLTVVKRIKSILPNENIVYFGDTARVPYGTKSNETVISYSLQNANFLMQKNVKAIVVACNTASSMSLPYLREKFNLPVIGMIEPGASYAASISKNKRIGIIGTSSTINNKAYSNSLKAIDPAIQVYEKACPLFVPLVEEGWIKHEATYIIVHEYLNYFADKDIDTLVLGCTHYPILIDTIKEVIGENINLIDVGLPSANLLRQEIERIGLITNSNSLGWVNLYVSDIPQKLDEIVKVFMQNIDFNSPIKVNL